MPIDFQPKIDFQPLDFQETSPTSFVGPQPTTEWKLSRQGRQQAPGESTTDYQSRMKSYDALARTELLKSAGMLGGAVLGYPPIANAFIGGGLGGVKALENLPTIMKAGGAGWMASHFFGPKAGMVAGGAAVAPEVLSGIAQGAKAGGGMPPFGPTPRGFAWQLGTPPPAESFTIPSPPPSGVPKSFLHTPAESVVEPGELLHGYKVSSPPKPGSPPAPRVVAPPPVKFPSRVPPEEAALGASGMDPATIDKLLNSPPGSLGNFQPRGMEPPPNAPPVHFAPHTMADVEALAGTNAEPVGKLLSRWVHDAAAEAWGPSKDLHSKLSGMLKTRYGVETMSELSPEQLLDEYHALKKIAFTPKP